MPVKILLGDQPLFGKALQPYKPTYQPADHHEYNLGLFVDAQKHRLHAAVTALAQNMAPEDVVDVGYSSQTDAEKASWWVPAGVDLSELKNLYTWIIAPGLRCSPWKTKAAYILQRQRLWSTLWTGASLFRMLWGCKLLTRRATKVGLNGGLQRSRQNSCPGERLSHYFR